MALHGYVARLASTRATWLTNSRRNLDPRYAAGEFFWYFNPTGDLNHIKHYAPQYEKFANDGTVLGAYGPRIRTAMTALYSLLVDSPNTRRAVLPLFLHTDLERADWANDVPCTLSYTFMIVNNELCMIANMRSNDVWLGLPYDVFVNTAIQRFLAGALRIKAGWYQHQVADLHIYGQNIKAAKEALQEGFPADDPYCVWSDEQADENFSHLFDAIQHEARYRLHSVRDDIKAITSPTVRSLLQCVLDVPIDSEILEDAYNRRHRLRRKDNTSS